MSMNKCSKFICSIKVVLPQCTKIAIQCVAMLCNAIKLTQW